MLSKVILCLGKVFFNYDFSSDTTKDFKYVSMEEVQSAVDHILPIQY